jgi:hypothetical protein
VTSGRVTRAQSVWLVPLLLSIVLALVITVSGCGSSATTTSRAPATTQAGASTTASGVGASSATTSSAPATTQAGASTTAGSGNSLALGMSSLPGGVPVFATTLFGAPVGVGTVNGQKPLPVLWSVTSGPKWSVQQIGTVERWPLAAFELNSQSILGDRALVVGQDARDAGSTTPENSFAAVAASDGSWHIVDMDSRVPAGNSIELVALGATGDPTDMNSFFIAVGGRLKGAPAAQYMSDDIAGAVPIATITVDGANWNPAVDLPLPAGVTSAEASAVSYCGSGTPAPGVIVAGTGQTSDPTRGTRTVGIVWRSTDNGTTWKVISDASFSEAGRNVDTQFLAADRTHIVVVGADDVSPALNAGTPAQRESLIWTLGSGGSWNSVDDGSSIPAGMSSTMTALAARAGGGFLLATQFYETSAGPTLPGGDLTHKQTMTLSSSPDGATWTEITKSVPDMGKSAIVNGIAESGGYAVFMGMDTSGNGAAWITDSASIDLASSPPSS